jgi:hypothetical protein
LDQYCSWSVSLIWIWCNVCKLFNLQINANTPCIFFKFSVVQITDERMNVNTLWSYSLLWSCSLLTLCHVNLICFYITLHLNTCLFAYWVQIETMIMSILAVLSDTKVESKVNTFFLTLMFQLRAYKNWILQKFVKFDMHSILKFADDTKILGRGLNDQDSCKLERDKGSLCSGQLSCRCSLKSGNVYCVVKNMGKSNASWQYTMNNTELDVDDVMKDLGVWISMDLKVSKSVCQS